MVDVGFGDSFQAPLRLDFTGEQAGLIRKYRIEPGDPYFVLWEKGIESDWAAQYRFRLEPHRLDEFSDGCLFHTTSPNSPFTRLRICSRLTYGGRISLSELCLIKNDRPRTP